MSFTLRQLECLAAVDEWGSIAAAATALHLSASAVSGAVTALERAFDTQLTVRRKAHGVELTPSGRYVVDEARTLLRGAKELRRHAADAGTSVRGALTVGCYLTLAPTVLAGLLDEYSRRHPLVELDFVDGSQRAVQERLRTGQLDVAIAYDLSLPQGLRRRRLYEATPSIVLAASHPLARRSTLSLTDVADEPLILLDVDPSRENTMRMFAAQGLEPTVRFRTTDYEVTRSFVGRGMGYAILVQQPAGDLSYEGRPLVVRRIDPPAPTVPVVIVWPDGIKPSRAATAMIELAAGAYAA